MSEPGLSGELRRRAEESAAAVIRTAEAEAERILRDAEDAIQTRQRDVLQDREHTLRAEARRRIAASRHQAMKDVLLSRTRVVDRVLEKAKALLPDTLKTEQYDSLLSKELEQALEFVGEGGAILRCTPALASTIRRSLVTKPSVAVEPSDDVGSGFVATDKEGRVRVDCTLEARLERLAPLLAIEIHRRLAETEP